jgi:hypothetical protein
MRSFGVPTALLVDQQRVADQRKSNAGAGGVAKMLQGALQGMGGVGAAGSAGAATDGAEGQPQ